MTKAIILPHNSAFSLDFRFLDGNLDRGVVFPLVAHHKLFGFADIVSI